MSQTDHLVMPMDHMEELYNSKNPLVRFVHRQRLDAIAAMLPRAANLKVLDAGCGEGHLLKRLYQSQPANIYYGVDVTEVALQKAKERCPFAELGKMDISRLDFPNGFFDVVTITEVLEHIIDYENVATELKRVLKPGGALIITFPNEVLWTVSRFLLRRRPIKVLDHVNAFNPKMMKKMVGLEVAAQWNLPFKLPFFMSLGCLMKFRK
jgi:2-polyprenyl-3-methyl-5-hydroxy-6-metoxy-1,4-benzoquinol methylase